MLLFLGFGNPLKAQNLDADSTDFAFLPAISYNSDFGFIAGGVASWYSYKQNHTPFYSYINTSAIATTRGLFSFSLEVDKPHVFDTNIRNKTLIYTARFFEDAFFGIGNYEKITDPPEGIPDFYEFKSFTIGLRNDTRFPLVRTSSTRYLDAASVIDFRYETPWDNNPDQLISNPAPAPPGLRGGRTLMLGGGLIWEGRDSEFRPTKGTYASSTVEVGQTIWGSGYNLLVWEHEMSQYLTFHLIKDVTFATRLYSEFTFGDVPYWRLAYAGDEQSIRGFESKRFMDDHVVYLNTELRTWLFEFPAIETELGGNLFFDIGRTFPNGENLDVIVNDLKYSAGFSGTASFFTRDFLIRGDFAFSEEGLGVYFTTGYMF